MIWPITSSSLHPLGEISRYHNLKTLCHMIWHAGITPFVILFLVVGIFVCSNTKLFKEVERRSLGSFVGRVGNTAALHFERRAMLSRGMPWLKVCSAVRSSVTLIFDISYGVHRVTIKDGDNLEMPPSIYTWRVSMRESRLKSEGGAQEDWNWERGGAGRGGKELCLSGRRIHNVRPHTDNS